MLNKTRYLVRRVLHYSSETILLNGIKTTSRFRVSDTLKTNLWRRLALRPRGSKFYFAVNTIKGNTLTSQICQQLLSNRAVPSRIPAATSTSSECKVSKSMEWKKWTNNRGSKKISLAPLDLRGNTVYTDTNCGVRHVRQCALLWQQSLRN